MSYLEYEVRFYTKSARTRYKSPYDSDWIGMLESFDDKTKAYEFASHQIQSGMFDVSMQVNRVTDDGDPDTDDCDYEYDVQDAPCPYALLGLNPLYFDLEEHRKETIEALFWAKHDAPGQIEKLEATLKQIEVEISELT